MIWSKLTTFLGTPWVLVLRACQGKLFTSLDSGWNEILVALSPKPLEF